MVMPAAFINGYLGFIAWGQGGTVELTGAFTSLKMRFVQSVTPNTSGAATWDTHNPAVRGWKVYGDFLLSSSLSTAGGSLALAAVVGSQKGTIMIGQFGKGSGQPKLGGLISWIMAEIDMKKNAAMTLTFEGLGNGAPAWTVGDLWT